MGGRRRNDLDGAADAPHVRILAVDDDRAYVNYLQLILTRAGFDVTVAYSGETAIDLVREDEEIGLLLVDLAMPLMDGIETVQKIRAEKSDVPGFYAILLTAHDGPEMKLHALSSGLDDFVTKTTPEWEIVAKLRNAARRMGMERRLHLENAELQTLALTDDLTGIANRRALMRAAEEILSAGRRLSVVLFDLDRFKDVNDTYGHEMGDRVLADVASCLKAQTRVGDLIARYGGDEFVLLLPDTDADEAQKIAARLCSGITALRWVSAGRGFGVGVQCGVESTGERRLTMARLLAACDETLYASKRA